MKPRPGHTLLELMVAMPLVFLLLALLLAGLHAQLRLTRRLADHVARSEAVRTAQRVLMEELRAEAAADLRTAAGDSIRMRVFRGVALPCNATSIAWSGLRAPAARKDSLLLLGADGETVLPVSTVTVDAACGGYRLGTGTSLSAGPALVFETGTYYLADGALRYRTGGEGRQPLTEEWLADGSTLHLDTIAGAASLAIAARPLRMERGTPTVWILPLGLPNIRHAQQ